MVTFSEHIRSMSDDALRGLISARPDAFIPTPPSAVSLATRLALPMSASRAMHQLTAADLVVLEQLADAGAELEPVNSLAMGDSAHLRSLALVYGPPEEARIAPGALSALPPGWRLTDVVPDGAAELVDKLPARERKILQTLAFSGGVGATKSPAAGADPDAPVTKLVEKGLLIRVDENTVRLPRPVREFLHGQTPRSFPLTEPPAPEVDQQEVDAAAVAQGLEAVRQMRQLLMRLLAEPVALNKDGTVGVRARASLAKDLGFDPAFMILVGVSAGLVGDDYDGDTEILAATRDALSWIDAILSDQWAILIAGWAACQWRMDTDEKIFADEMYAPYIRETRLRVLRYGGDLRRLLFHAPLSTASWSEEFVASYAAEAEQVGALALGAPSTPALALLNGEDVAAAARPLVPPAVDTLIAQADMTVLAPGPLEPEVASFLGRIAELESPGVASVWRITEAKVRSALDAGSTADEITGWLDSHVLGEVPQAVTFIVQDAARNHGAIRAGAVGSYIRSEDPALIARAAEIAGVRVLAPTVAVSELALPKLMAVLREAGLQPAAEDAQGATVSMAPEPVLVSPTPSTLPVQKAIDAAQADAIIAKLRASDTAEETGGDTLETLRAAARARRHVALGYVDKHGHGQTITVVPLSVTAGQVDALDEAGERVVRIALPRITKVVLA
ncbi:helicase-associated domain-containing protein [Corynebacterium sp. Marseille-P4321]|uniref:helicase-associated domain-containing protein n=1 Tax=Corynebacterium sp. Marseille-P4321 TaxID=2736603 RepID=UPI00158BB99A|nr:helicase-associated domain-containing protein [Corynebacterium sp. Marseille-P4321]